MVPNKLGAAATVVVAPNKPPCAGWAPNAVPNGVAADEAAVPNEVPKVVCAVEAGVPKVLPNAGGAEDGVPKDEPKPVACWEGATVPKEVPNPPNPVDAVVAGVEPNAVPKPATEQIITKLSNFNKNWKDHFSYIIWSGSIISDRSIPAKLD